MRWSCFFVKQKTAYDMRISDWSSDVCSSDRLDAGIEQRQRRAVSGPVGGRDHRTPARPDAVEPDQPLRRRTHHDTGQVVVAEHQRLVESAGRARNSVVEGKGESVHVNLCGSRIRKTKKKKKTVNSKTK